MFEYYFLKQRICTQGLFLRRILYNKSTLCLETLKKVQNCEKKSSENCAKIKRIGYWASSCQTRVKRPLVGSTNNYQMVPTVFVPASIGKKKNLDSQKHIIAPLTLFFPVYQIQIGSFRLFDYSRLSNLYNCLPREMLDVIFKRDLGWGAEFQREYDFSDERKKKDKKKTEESYTKLHFTPVNS